MHASEKHLDAETSRRAVSSVANAAPIDFFEKNFYERRF